MGNYWTYSEGVSKEIVRMLFSVVMIIVIRVRMDSTRRRSAVPRQTRFGTRRRCALPRHARFPSRVIRHKGKRKLRGGVRITFVQTSS